jgi:hypothetical protein
MQTLKIGTRLYANHNIQCCDIRANEILFYLGEIENNPIGERQIKVLRYKDMREYAVWRAHLSFGKKKTKMQKLFNRIRKFFYF